MKQTKFYQYMKNNGTSESHTNKCLKTNIGHPLNSLAEMSSFITLRENNGLLDFWIQR